MDAVREAIRRGVPFLGICLGLHLMFEEGTEDAGEDGNPRGLGIVPGVVDRMPGVDAEGVQYKVPHVGWNTIDILPGTESPLLEGIPSGEYFYFTHSFIAPENPCTLAGACRDFWQLSDN